MIEKKIKFADYNGKTVTKTFTFHMNKADIAEFKYRKDGSDIVDLIKKIMETENVRGVFDMLKEIARSSVGRRSEDGARFIKDDEARSELFDTDAYAELLMELIEKPNAASNFIAGILPEDLAKKVRASASSDDLQNLSKEELLRKMQELEDSKKESNEETNE